MDPELRDLLCQEVEWEWGGDGFAFIRFNTDGTGMLALRIELTMIVCLNFEWKLLDEPYTNGHHRQENSPTVLAKLLVEIKMSDNIAYECNKANLLESAYLPRQHRLTLTEGRYTVRAYNAASDVILKYRLAIDPSPYPALENWSEYGQNRARRLRYPEWQYFHREVLEYITYGDYERPPPPVEEDNFFEEREWTRDT
ncbi:hypothetical protein PspLS_01742 [Pyricularia sp. CBS 133598]|nr:hypothetical protein PspLS_01742 [Pyricularia sp. CBS 133598]